MATLGRWQGGTVSIVPTTSFAVPTSDLFNSGSAIRNDGTAYALNTSGRLTLPSSSLADGYLMIARVTYADTSNGRVSIAGRFQQTGGTGNFVNLQTGSYSRNTANDYLTVGCAAFVDNPSASATFDFQWERESDAPTGGTSRGVLEVIPFFYADIGMYTGSSATLMGGTTRNVVPIGATVLEGTNITRSSNIVTVTGDNKRYMVLSSQWYQDRGEPSTTRTQRIFGHDYDGSADLAAQAYAYYRQATADGTGSMIHDIIETVTASRTVEMTCYRGDGVASGDGGAALDGQAPTQAITGLVVIELNDTAECFRTHDATGLQALDSATPLDINAVRTTDFIDAASWLKVGTVGMENNDGAAFDALTGANVWAASTNVGNGTRGSYQANITVDGVEDADLYNYNYIRGNQGTDDTFGWAANPIGFRSLADNADLGVSVTQVGELHQTDTQADTVGFWGINLDTMASTGETATGAPSVFLPTAAGTAGIDRNATGAPSIILPTASGTAEVIKKATGAAALVLIAAAGVAELINTASGAPEVFLPTAAGTAEVINTATGSPSIILPTAAGTAGIDRSATGAPSIILPTAAGVAEVNNTATGAPSIILPTSAGTASVAFAAKDTSVRVTFGTPASPPKVGAGLQRFNLNLRRDAAHVGGSGIPTVNVYLYEDGVQRGAALLSGVAITSDSGQVVEALWDAADLVTSSTGSAVECFVDATANGSGADRRAVEVGAIEWCSVADEGVVFANGAPSIILPTSAGTAGIDRNATGAPSIILPTSQGTAEVIKTADGAPSIILPTSAGTAEILNTATGAPSVILPTSAGVAEIIKTADGAPSIILPTSAGTVTIDRNATGAPSVFLPTSAGTAEIIKTADGAPSIILPTSAGTAEILNTATGAPSIILPTAAGVAEIIKTATGAPSIILPTSAGTVALTRKATGAPVLPLITSAGTASTEGVFNASGAPAIILPTSAGTATVERNATGAPSIILPTSSGAAEIIKPATGAPEIFLPTSAGVAEVFKPATGAPSIILPTSSGVAEVIKIASGAPSIILPTSAGVADVEGTVSANGAPSIPLLTSAGVATVTGDADQVHPPGTSRKRKKLQQLLDEDELLFVIITAFLQIKDD